VHCRPARAQRWTPFDGQRRLQAETGQRVAVQTRTTKRNATQQPTLQAASRAAPTVPLRWPRATGAKNFTDIMFDLPGSIQWRRYRPGRHAANWERPTVT
jgi:hypothetical protein